MIAIDIGKGLVTLVDDGDFEQASKFKWSADFVGTKIYADRVNQPTRKKIYLHRQILGVTDSAIRIDHKDGDGLNNQRSNLRFATQSENLRNRGVPSHNSSGYKGVSYYKRDGTWESYVKVDGRKIRLGYFHDPISAAAAYDIAAEKHYGQFAKTNKSMGLL